MSRFSQQYLAFYGVMSIIAFVCAVSTIVMIWGTQKEASDTNIALQQAINQIYKDRPQQCFSGSATAKITEKRELSVMLQDDNSHMSRNFRVDLGDENVETPTKSEVPSVDDFTDEVRSPYEFDRNTLWKMSRCYSSSAEQKKFLNLVSRWEQSKSPFNYVNAVGLATISIITSVILVGAACEKGEDKRPKRW